MQLNVPAHMSRGLSPPAPDPESCNKSCACTAMCTQQPPTGSLVALLHPSTCTDHEPRKAERRPGLVTREWLHGAQLYGCLPLLSSMVEHMHMYMYMYTYMLYM